MKKNGLKRILLVLSVLLLVSATVVGIVFATGAALQSGDPVKLDIVATNLSFSDSVYIKYAVTLENVDASNVKILVWTTPQTEYIKGTEAAELSTVGFDEKNSEWLIFNYKGLAAKQMADDVYAVAYANVNGTEYYSAPKKYSILQYAYNKMGKTGTASDDSKLITLLEDMLEYGALAQKYTNYKTDTLANGEFSQIKLIGGVHTDGFDHGLYKVGSSVTITAPALDDGFEFVGWKTTSGFISSTEPTATVTVGENNEVYSAVYQGNTSDKLQYALNDDGITYSVVGMGECEETNIIIPSVVNGKLVTKIADGAFMGHSDILSVKISKNITSIGANAFNGCASLDTIYFDGSDYEWTLIEKGENWNQNAGKCEMRYSEINDDWELEGAPIG